MDAVSDPLIEEIDLMCASQTGKTEILNNVVGYHIDQDPSPILCVQPTVEMGKTWSKDRLAPMLRDTKCLHGKVKDARSRDANNTTLHKVFPGGHITIAGANSPAGLAMRPIRIVLCDEVDRYPPSAGSEGDPVSLAFKRATTFWNRKKMMTSTPTVKGQSRIEQAFNRSDKRRFYVPCPHCGEFQVLKWAQVRWPEGEPWAASAVSALKPGSSEKTD
jgi:phage terminase large subunit GpA-like protein